MDERTFCLSGEYDMENASDLEASLLRFAHGDGQGPMITVDAEQLRFIDSSGIGVLLRVREVLESEGRTLRVVNLPAMTRRVLEALDLIEILGVDRPGEDTASPEFDHAPSPTVDRALRRTRP
jgi:anti-anti-sigma factor